MSAAPQRADPRFRRHLVVLLALTLVAAVGIALVVTGHRSSRATTTTSAASPATTAPLTTLRSLGHFASDAALRDAVRRLDPTTLRPKAGSAPTTAGPPRLDPRRLACQAALRTTHASIAARRLVCSGRINDPPMRGLTSKTRTWPDALSL